MEATKYTRDQLEQLGTGKLGWLYMHLFSKSPLIQSSQLEDIVVILFNRPDVKEKVITRNQIRHQLVVAVKREDYKEAAMYKRMQHYYEKHIMG